MDPMLGHGSVDCRRRIRLCGGCHTGKSARRCNRFKLHYPWRLHQSNRSGLFIPVGFRLLQRILCPRRSNDLPHRVDLFGISRRSVVVHGRLYRQQRLSTGFCLCPGSWHQGDQRPTIRGMFASMQLQLRLRLWRSLSFRHRQMCS